MLICQKTNLQFERSKVDFRARGKTDQTLTYEESTEHEENCRDTTNDIFDGIIDYEDTALATRKRHHELSGNLEIGDLLDYVASYLGFLRVG